MASPPRPTAALGDRAPAQGSGSGASLGDRRGSLSSGHGPSGSPASSRTAAAHDEHLARLAHKLVQVIAAARLPSEDFEIVGRRETPSNTEVGPVRRR